MKKVLWFIGIITVLIATCLSGCQQKGTTTDSNTFKNITLDSDVVELVYSKLDFSKDEQGHILNVEVRYLFRNIANRDIGIKVFVEFYDKGDNLLATEGPKEINLPKGWIEQGVAPANIITYTGENVAEVDHVKIIAEERY